MERFLDGNIIRIDCSLSNGINMITICESIVTKIMTNSCHYNTKCVKFVEIQFYLHMTFLQHMVCHLHYIHTMQVIMILDICFICHYCFIQKHYNLVVIQNSSKIQTMKDFKRRYRQYFFSFQYFSQFKYIKVNFLNAFQF